MLVFVCWIFNSLTIREEVLFELDFDWQQWLISFSPNQREDPNIFWLLWRKSMIYRIGFSIKTKSGNWLSLRWFCLLLKVRRSCHFAACKIMGKGSFLKMHMSKTHLWVVRIIWECADGTLATTVWGQFIHAIFLLGLLSLLLELSAEYKNILYKVRYAVLGFNRFNLHFLLWECDIVGDVRVLK